MKKNILSGSVVQGLTIFIVFFSYPVYIHFLGFEQFSVWVLLSVIISLAQFGDFGIGKAIINFVAASKQDKDEREIPVILLNGLIVILFISFLIQIGINIFAGRIVILLNVPPKYIQQAIYVIPLLGFAIFTFLIYDCIASTLTGIGRLDIYNFLLLLLNISKIGLTILLLISMPNIASMVYGVLITNVLFIVIALFILNYSVNYFHFSIRYLKISIMIRLVKYGLPLLGIQVVNILMFPFIKVIISRVFGVEFVGFFELASKAAYSFRTLFEKGLFALLPEFSKFSESYFKDIISRQKLRQHVYRMTKSIVLYGIPFILTIALLSKILLKVWLNNSFNEKIYIGFLLLQPGIIVGLLALPSYYALMAIRRQIYCFFESVIRILLAFILFSLFFKHGVNFVESFLFVSLAVIASNVFVMLSFKYKT